MRRTPRLAALGGALVVALLACDRPPPAADQPAASSSEEPIAAKSGPGAEGSARAGGAAAEEITPAEAAPEPSNAAAADGPEVAENGGVDPIEVDIDPDAPALENPKVLASFFSALDQVRAQKPGAIARVLHMGDSSVGLDGLPQAIRKRMQERFGDAGPGFVLVDRFSKNYSSNVAKLDAGGWKICYIAYLCKKDGHYGLGGHTFKGAGDAWTKIGPHPRSSNGRNVSKIELWYAATPRGGDLRLRVDKGAYELINTRAETLEDRWHEVHVPVGEHSLELRGSSSGTARVYGVAMENEGPGVVWDTVSMTGAYVRRLHGYDDEHIAGQVAHRDPDLLVISYGGNDLRRFVSKSVTREDYKEEYRTTVRKLRQGKDGLACLLTGVSDHGRSGTYTVREDHMEMMTAIEREVALEEGCAFFDTVAAMGGAGSVQQWIKEGKVSPDQKHLSRKGIDAMGAMMYEAILAAYASR